IAKSTSRISSPESLRTNQPTLSRKACSGSLQQRTAVALAASQQRSRSPHASSAQPPPPRESATSASASSSSSGSSGGGAGATDRPSVVTPGPHMALRSGPARARARVPPPAPQLPAARAALTWPRLGGRRSPRHAKAAGGGYCERPVKPLELLTLTLRAQSQGLGARRPEPTEWQRLPARGRWGHLGRGQLHCCPCTLSPPGSGRVNAPRSAWEPPDLD
uniref:Uncharacterized protein n=1 Tax=Oryctolagus cuniculus TaxID=9986 RepID=A0A5F9C354_RABIT